jgi:hypothetical protein
VATRPRRDTADKDRRGAIIALYIILYISQKKMMKIGKLKKIKKIGNQIEWNKKGRWLRTKICEQNFQKSEYEDYEDRYSIRLVH